MKTLSLITLLLAFTTNSFADIAPLSANLHNLLSNASTEQTNEPSILDRLMVDFENGTMPDFTAMKGWWTGRCYEPKAPNTALGAMLTATETTLTEGGDNGPGFPPVTRMIQNMAFLGYGGTSAPANYFDHLSDTDRADYEKFITTDVYRGLIPFAYDNSLNTDHVSGNIRYSVRKNSEYFYGKATFLKDGDLFVGCYFFRKIHD